MQPAGEDAGRERVVVRADGAAVDVQLVAPGFLGTQPALPFNAGEAGIADTVIGQIGQLKRTAGVDEPTDAVGRNFLSGGWRVGCGVNDGEGAPRQGFRMRTREPGSRLTLSAVFRRPDRAASDPVDAEWCRASVRYDRVAKAPSARIPVRCLPVTSRRPEQRGEDATSGSDPFDGATCDRLTAQCRSRPRVQG